MASSPYVGFNMTEPVPFEITMAALREHFTTRARSEGEELKLLAGTVVVDETALNRIRRIAHSLAGAAAIFGMPAVSTEAADLEEAIVDGAPENDIASQSTLLADRLTNLGSCQPA